MPNTMTDGECLQVSIDAVDGPRLAYANLLAERDRLRALIQTVARFETGEGISTAGLDWLIEQSRAALAKHGE